MFSYWSSSDNKSFQVSRTRLNILADLNNAVVCMVSNCSLISKSSGPFTYSLVTVPTAPITIGTVVTFMSHCFITSLARSRYLSIFSLSFIFTLWSAGTVRSTIQLVLSLFFFLRLSLGLVVWPRLDDPFVSQNPWEICASHSPGQIMSCAYTTYYYYYYYYYARGVIVIVVGNEHGDTSSNPGRDWLHFT